MAHTVLVVDDDPSILAMIKKFLESRSYNVITADNGAAALNVLRDAQPDLVLSDAKMPVLDGHTLCRLIRKETSEQSIPLILMSGAWMEESNVLAGFEGGADDYLMKPLSLPVLKARIEAVLRRYEGVAKSGAKLRRSGLELDPEGRSASVNGKKVQLTRKEFDLLVQLVSKAGRVLSVPFLLETVWGYDPSDYNDPGTVETHISHLRKKLGREIGARIVNLTGHGYKFEET
jgi:two-component system, OmpR family, response regulator VanR